MTTPPTGARRTAAALVHEMLRTAYPHLLPGALTDPATTNPGSPRQTDLGADARPLGAAEFADLAGSGRWGDFVDALGRVGAHYWAPKLWGRFTMALRRAVARDLEVAATKVHEVATVQFVKVAEDQERAAVHYHALIRLDGPRSTHG